MELLSIPFELTGIKELDGHAKGTRMSIANLVAYLIGWGELVLKWNSKKAKNENVDFPETDYKWNELGKLAQKFYADYEKDDFKTLLKKLDATVANILELVNKKTNHQLYETAWYDTWPLGRLIQLNTSSPYANATARIRKWKKEKKLK